MRLHMNVMKHKIKKKIKILLCGAILSLALSTQAYAADQIVDLTVAETFSSKDYQQMAMSLAKQYPEIIKYEEIGKSYDQKPIYAIVLTHNADVLYGTADFKVIRKHYLMEAGTHARETANPGVLLKMVEEYARDYYDDSVIEGYNLREILNTSALHFVPMLNPDGHDLAKFGLGSIQTEAAKKALQSMKDDHYGYWKANVRGVDINRNFVDEYIDVQTGEWVDKWQKYVTKYDSDTPGGSYYPGTPASEPETQAFMAYIDRYDFRSYTAYHSKGEVLYYTFDFHPVSFNDDVNALATMISNITGYVKTRGTENGGGYSTEYFATMTLKPTLTVETMPFIEKLPSPSSQFTAIYQKVKTVPLETVLLLRNEPYGHYKLYDASGNYVRDFEIEVYAKAHAERINGTVSKYVGKPKMTMKVELTREAALLEILKSRFDLSKLTLDANDRFTDTDSIFATFAKNMGIVKGSADGKFYPDRPITPFEYAIICYDADKHLKRIENDDYLSVTINFSCPSWAKEAIQYTLYKGIMTESDFKSRFMFK